MTMHEMHTREMPLQFEMRDDAAGLTVEGLVLPYNREAEIVEVRSAGPIRYWESMAPGCAERNFRAPHRLAFMYGHTEAFDQRLGHATQLRESAEGLVITFRLDRSRAEHARDVLSSSHSGLSVAFLSVVPKPMSERAGEHVLRKAIYLGHVAAVAEPAYEDARVLAMRSMVDDPVPTQNEVEHEARLAQQRELFDWISTAKTEQEVWRNKV